MIRTLLNISQGKSKYHIVPAVGHQLASLLYFTLDKQLPFSAENFTELVPSRAAGPGRNYRVEGSGAGNTDMRVRVHTIHGVMMMSGGMCSYGMIEYGEMIKRADADPDIDAHVLDIYSPGGQVDYTETLSEIIANTTKPVVVWANQMVASAAYHIASGANEIMLSGKSAEVGSIGTLISYLDATRRMKEKGVDHVLITATKSTKKVKYNWWEPSEEDQDFIREDYIDPSNELFHETVRANRPGAVEEVFTADMFTGQSAIQAGLADSMGSLEDAVLRAAELATNQSNDHSTMNQQSEKKNAFEAGVAKLRQIAGFEKAAVIEETPTPVQEEDAPESPELTHTAEEFADMQARIDQLEQEKTDLTAQLDAQQTELDQLNEEVKQLGDRSAKKPVEVATIETVTDAPASGAFAQVNAEAQRRFGHRNKK